MRFLPDSAIYGTYKRAKYASKRKRRNYGFSEFLAELSEYAEYQAKNRQKIKK